MTNYKIVYSDWALAHIPAHGPDEAAQLWNQDSARLTGDVGCPGEFRIQRRKTDGSVRIGEKFWVSEVQEVEG